ncbi:GntR family transcriptional regulator [Actinomadura sp. NBRC 104412]|uniref:FadR/GntR family transcriptional regulator n=1 Tax=Actinomadura sp. NBRC 104412 TaxID=3032203 RepID=UPI0024A0AF59|nr:FadR/GntR family transcriptional regulator [Actinomadura sp. NBRC 104412]GLZ07827.1 GntR family transcriptional regulator [Actinomadura sp. NBRC 104412]
MAPGPPEASGGKSTEDLFSPVSVGRISEVIVEQMRMLIREGKLVPGDRLPSERSLCERFGVSRVTVREALRVLEASGLVEIRVGARGGAFVTSPSSERVGEGLAELLALAPMTGSDVTEARMVFELGILPLVVERATEEDIADLRSLVEQGMDALEDGSYTMDMSAAFHVRVASSTHNPAIEMLVQSFHGPLLMSLQQAQVAAPLMGARGAHEHYELVAAIEQRDLERARAIMTRHLQRTADRLAERANAEGSDAAPPEGSA